jgi:hypothetical protein
MVVSIRKYLSFCVERQRRLTTFSGVLPNLTTISSNGGLSNRSLRLAKDTVGANAQSDFSALPNSTPWPTVNYLAKRSR